MKKITNKLSVSTILLIGGLILSACTASEKPAGEKGSVGGAEQTKSTTAENKPAENKATNEDSTMTQDDLPELKKGEDYKKSVREKMLKAGWKPARSKQADGCGSAEPTCDEFDEYESKTEKDSTNFRWQKDSKFVEISTSSYPYVFESYQFEKDSMTIAQNERWKEFWEEFKTAIDTKNKEKLKNLMAEKIDGGGAVETREERIAAIEESDMWASMQKTIAEESKIDKCDRPCRSSKDGYLLFSYNNRIVDWEWSGLGGEGGS